MWHTLFAHLQRYTHTHTKTLLPSITLLGLNKRRASIVSSHRNSARRMLRSQLIITRSVQFQCFISYACARGDLHSKACCQQREGFTRSFAIITCIGMRHVPGTPKVKRARRQRPQLECTSVKQIDTYIISNQRRASSSASYYDLYAARRVAKYVITANVQS